VEEAASPDFESLNARGGNGLCAKEDLSEDFGAHERPSVEVKPEERCLSGGNCCSDFARQLKLATHEGIGNIGLVLAASTVSTR